MSGFSSCVLVFLALPVYPFPLLHPKHMCSKGSVLGLLPSLTWILFTLFNFNYSSVQMAIHNTQYILLNTEHSVQNTLVPKSLLAYRFLLNCLLDTSWNLELSSWNPKLSTSKIKLSSHTKPVPPSIFPTSVNGRQPGDSWTAKSFPSEISFLCAPPVSLDLASTPARI